MTDKITLLPCPFCGGRATFEEVKHGDVSNWTVGCEDADGECYGYQSLTSFARKAEAANAWNSRTTPTEDLMGEKERLTAVIANMDACSPLADKTCAEPGITLSQAVEREYPHLRRASLPQNGGAA